MEKPNRLIGKRGTSYPPEFREESVRYWLSSGKKVAEVARELGVSDWSLHRWRKEMEQVNASIPIESGELNALELAKENGRLRRELEAMTQQREILKKAISIFLPVPLLVFRKVAFMLIDIKCSVHAVSRTDKSFIRGCGYSKKTIIVMVARA